MKKKPQHFISLGNARMQSRFAIFHCSPMAQCYSQFQSFWLHINNVSHHTDSHDSPASRSHRVLVILFSAFRGASMSQRERKIERKKRGRIRPRSIHADTCTNTHTHQEKWRQDNVPYVWISVVRNGNESLFLWRPTNEYMLQTVNAKYLIMFGGVDYIVSNKISKLCVKCAAPTEISHCLAENATNISNIIINMRNKCQINSESICMNKKRQRSVHQNWFAQNGNELCGIPSIRRRITSQLIQ